MATINKMKSSHMTGKVGALVYRYVGDQVIISRAPQHYRTSKSESALQNRHRWKLYNALASGIRRIYLLNNLWRDAPIDGRNVINKLISTNASRITKELDYSNILLVPEEETFQIELDSFTYTDEIISVKINPLHEQGIETFEVPYISAQGLICITEPKYPNQKEYCVIPLQPVIKPLDLESPLEFEFHIITADEQDTRLYNKKSILLNLITHKTNSKLSQSSNNIFIEV